MAKGNDGNYLQHSVEVSLANLLAQPSGSLHITLTHGMAPVEACGVAPTHQLHHVFDDALIAASGPHRTGEEGVVAAYRATGATRESYPNSGELISATLGRGNLTGAVAEVCSDKYAELQAVWADSNVQVIRGSWREPAFLEDTSVVPAGPWLFSMDPMTYSLNVAADDDKIYRDDTARIASALASLAADGAPGAATIFVYAIRPDFRSAFWEFAETIASRVGMSLDRLWMPHQGGNRNLCALLRANGAGVPDSWPPAGVRVARTSVGMA